MKETIRSWDGSEAVVCVINDQIVAAWDLQTGAFWSAWSIPEMCWDGSLDLERAFADAHEAVAIARLRC